MNNKIKYMYCISINNEIFEKISNFGYIPVGLGDKKFSDNWIRDNIGENISKKNKYYGEYTFHYYFWKNLMNKIPNDEWIGFCGYRRFWKDKNILDKKIKKNILEYVPDEWNNYEVIIGDKLDIKRVKWIKVLKYGKLALLKNPKILLSEKFRNIKFHFDMFHGNGVIDKAIEQLNTIDKIDFYNYVRSNTGFNQGNMFVTKSKKIMNEYYSVLFEWLNKCEKIFGFDLRGYNRVRTYAFLAERFLSYWFKKNTKYLEWPIVFHDLTK
jgi:hypothetical protein